MLPVSDPSAVRAALAVLKAGGLVAFPTDTVYGLGALAFEGAAVAKLYRVKGRGRGKAIPVLIADWEMLDRVATDPPPVAKRLAQEFWPGPLTLIVERSLNLPGEVSIYPTVGIRVPDHPFALALLSATGPLAVTSANPSGEQNATTAQQVRDYFHGEVGLILDGGKAPGGRPSTVIDCTREGLKILREGPISQEEISKLIERQPGN